MRRQIWTALGPLMLCAVLAGCAAQPSVDAALIGIAPESSTLLEQRLRLDFRLRNFGERALSATGLEINLDVNGRQLARGVQSDGFRLERLGETRVSAVVSTSLFEVARQLLELPDREQFSYRLRGRVYLQGWPRSVPFSHGGEISRAELSRLVGAGGREPQRLRLD